MNLAKDPFNVIIAGVGGQGNVLASQILGEILVNHGAIVTVGETYGASQRGGSVMSHVRISNKEQCSPLMPEGRCDMVVALEPIEALRILDFYGNPAVVTLTNTRPIYPMDVICGNVNYPDVSEVVSKVKAASKRVWTIDATDMAMDMGDPIMSNIIMLGALCGTDILPFDRNGFESVAAELLPASKLGRNLVAFDQGMEKVKELH
jgi:indolepyruvate ferredoxin oxidoreductase beta subunit